LPRSAARHAVGQIGCLRGERRRLLRLVISVAALTLLLAGPASTASAQVVNWGLDYGGFGSEGFDLPANPSGLSGAVAVAAGEQFSLALLSDGRVIAWGQNGLGELGRGSAEASKAALKVTGVREATAIAAGWDYGLALLRNGTAVAWGDNRFGQLGDGTMSGPEKCGSSACSTFAAPVEGLSEVTAIAAGPNQSLALRRDGTVLSWGGESHAHPTPTPVSGLSEVTAISAGDEGNLALLKNGTVMEWNEDGGPPQAVSGLSSRAVGLPNGGDEMVLLSNGTVMDWGGGYTGQLGNGTEGPGDESAVPVAVSGLSGVTVISEGSETRLALLGNGTVMAWGERVGNGFGEGRAGEGERQSDVPVQVGGLSEIDSIANGQYFSLVATPATSELPRTTPTIVTGGASSLTQDSATVNATVNPNGEDVSECEFEYGTTSSYGSNAPCAPSPGSGTAAVAVSASIGQLTANTTYHFRVRATNPEGTSESSDATFTTPPLAKVHWYWNGVRFEEGVKAPFISWGRLAFSGTNGGASTECLAVAGGYVENPVGGSAGAFEKAGVDSIEAFDLYDCVNTECEAAGGMPAVTAEDLPWSGSLSEEAERRVGLSTTAVRLFIHCRFGSQAPTERAGVGAQVGLEERTTIEYNAPGALSCATTGGGSWLGQEMAGSSAEKPSKTKFSEPGGELECGSGGTTITTGSLKMLGYGESTVLSAKGP
jgi:alpha-tubulin suppressor-like RCC1 family protein